MSKISWSKKKREADTFETDTTSGIKRSDYSLQYFLYFSSVGLLFTFGRTFPYGFYVDSLSMGSTVMLGGFLGTLKGACFHFMFGWPLALVFSKMGLLLSWIVNYFCLNNFLQTESVSWIYLISFINGVLIGSNFFLLFTHIHLLQHTKNVYPLGIVPQFGLTSGIYVAEVVSSSMGWRYAALFGFIYSSLMLLFPLPQLEPSNVLLLEDKQDVESQKTRNEENNSNTTHERRTIAYVTNNIISIELDESCFHLSKALIQVTVQHLTGLTVISIPELICTNLTVNPSDCFRFFFLTITTFLAFAAYFDMNSRMGPTRFISTTFLSSIVYILVLYMFQVKTENKLFVDDLYVKMAMLIYGVTTAMSCMQFPLISSLDKMSPITYRTSLLVTLCLWWGVGSLFNRYLCRYLHEHMLYDVFVYLAMTSLALTVIALIFWR